MPYCFFKIQFSPHAVWLHAAIPAPCASRCFFFLPLCHHFLGWFLRIVSVFQTLNSLKQSLFFQTDSVKHNWHFGAVEYTRLTFTQRSNAISALCWLYLPPRLRPSVIRADISLIECPQSPTADIYATFGTRSHASESLACMWIEDDLFFFLAIRCHAVRYPSLKTKQ